MKPLEGTRIYDRFDREPYNTEAHGCKNNFFEGQGTGIVESRKCNEGVFVNGATQTE